MLRVKEFLTNTFQKKLITVSLYISHLWNRSLSYIKYFNVQRSHQSYHKTVNSFSHKRNHISHTFIIYIVWPSSDKTVEDKITVSKAKFKKKHPYVIYLCEKNVTTLCKIPKGPAGDIFYYYT